ncbi:hypothetical protein Q0F98_04330 [Paenibacillus amylolyticus]|nr:hypothetical protein Q0F98_04330 [Paenibacillus amylolyticus]
MRSGGHFAAVPYVNAAWPSLRQVLPGASLSRRLALSLRSLRASWTFALAKPVCRVLRSPGGWLSP